MLNSKTQALNIFQGRLFLIEIPLKSMRGGISGRHESSFNNLIPQKLLSAEAGNGNVKAKVFFQALSGNSKEGGSLDLLHGDGILLISELTGGSPCPAARSATPSRIVSKKAMRPRCRA